MYERFYEKDSDAGRGCVPQGNPEQRRGGGYDRKVFRKAVGFYEQATNDERKEGF